MPELRVVQEEFWAAITAPEGASSERLNVYANMYFYRLRDNLALDYPVLAAVLGADRFHNLITDYLLAHPSRDPNVRNVGRALPEFLAPGWLADLAALEWARADVFDREDEPILRDLATHARAGFTRLTLRLVRAQARVAVQHDVESVWRARTGPGVRGPRVLVVWRNGALIHHRPLDADELALWPQLERGVSFVELCAQLRLPMEQAAQRALQLVCSWATSELLAEVR
jgi:hypothetical protein